MLSPFFILAAQSPSRQHAFRTLVVVHLCLLLAAAWLVAVSDPVHTAPYLGHLLLIAGIVEGAVLLGWRLTQLPRSQALEFLLVSPLRPRRVFLGEALVGLARLGLVTLAGLPILAVLTSWGCLYPEHLVLVVVMPFTWGAVTGLGLTVWAYETQGIRRWGERVMIGLVIVYLVIGLLVAEHLRDFLDWLPNEPRQWFIDGFLSFHRYNPFALMHTWLGRDPFASWEWTLGVELAAAAGTVLLLARGACRLKGHFHDRHYQPAVDRSKRKRPAVGDRPLSWWAVKRVTQYAGRINIWLAGGCGVLYALYTMAGPHWPAWLGRQVFLLFDQAGGIPVIATGLVLLAAVPAAFQYGLWDSSATDRCRRLELLLLTRLDGRDYWEAAGAAAWRRGRGYFGVAVLLWVAAVVAGQAGLGQALAAAATGVLLWGLYFALGFRAFSRGLQANGLGMLLTLGLPLIAFGLYRCDWPALAALFPPGSVYGVAARSPTLAGLPGPVLAAGLALLLGRRALAGCDRELRRWYELHHGRKGMD
jgi:hypothetical protein